MQLGGDLSMAKPWPPTTLIDLELALTNGLLTEGHFLDLKRELPQAGRNEGIAIDLAAFSVDGGLLLYGVDEDTSPPTIAPIPLDGAAERIEQVGLASVDPPVRVSGHVLETDPGHGVLVVIVPPSPQAPHMVGGKYRGRSDRTNHVLGDAEVRRIHGDLAAGRDEIEEELRAFAEEALRRHGTGVVLLMVASPALGGETLVLDSAGRDPLKWVTDLVTSGPMSSALSVAYGPDFRSGLTVDRRAGGWSVARHPGAIEIGEDGRIRLAISSLEGTELGVRLVNDVAINGLVLRVILLAAEIGARCHHLGPWSFAISITGLRGTQASSTHAAHPMRRVDMPPYAEEVYVQSGAATWEEVARQPADVRNRLLGRLNRGLGGPNAVIPDVVIRK